MSLGHPNRFTDDRGNGVERQFGVRLLRPRPDDVLDEHLDADQADEADASGAPSFHFAAKPLKAHRWPPHHVSRPRPDVLYKTS